MVVALHMLARRCALVSMDCYWFLPMAHYVDSDGVAMTFSHKIKELECNRINGVEFDGLVQQCFHPFLSSFK